MDTELCGTKVTGHQIQSVLSKSKRIDIGDHAITSVDAEILGDQGYSSIVLRVKLSWSTVTNGHDLPESVIVKATGRDDAIDAAWDEQNEKAAEFKKHLHFSHNVECSIYELEELQDTVPMPRGYGSVKQSDSTAGVLILEDLQPRGVLLPKTVLFGRGPNPAQLDSLLDFLTTLHAWSVNTKLDWQSKIPKNADNPVLATFAEATRTALPQTKKEFPELFKDLDDEKIDKFLTTKTYMEYFGCDPTKKYGLPLVLVHGDIQPLNILFEKNSDGKDGDHIAGLVDWQLAHQGCGMEDLIRLMGWCMHHKDRRARDKEILERYVELFNQKVDNPKNKITFEKVKRAVDDLFAFNGIMFGCAVMALSTMAARMTGITEDERDMVKKDLIERHSENYKDAVKILGW